MSYYGVKTVDLPSELSLHLSECVEQSAWAAQNEQFLARVLALHAKAPSIAIDEELNSAGDKSDSACKSDSDACVHSEEDSIDQSSIAELSKRIAVKRLQRWWLEQRAERTDDTRDSTILGKDVARRVQLTRKFTHLRDQLNSPREPVEVFAADDYRLGTPLKQANLEQRQSIASDPSTPDTFKPVLQGDEILF